MHFRLKKRYSFILSNSNLGCKNVGRGRCRICNLVVTISCPSRLQFICLSSLHGTLVSKYITPKELEMNIIFCRYLMFAKTMIFVNRFAN